MFDTLFYGVDEFGSIRHIDNVDSGLSCNCVCPTCGGKLVAKKGDKMIHHFAHKSGESCEYGFETSLHIMAKELFLVHKKVYLPKYQLIGGRVINEEIFDCYCDIKDVHLEKRISGFVPDVIIDTNYGQIIVEIYVTHKCGLEKRTKIKSLGIPVVEVNLSKIKGYHLSKQELWTYMRKNSSWVYADFSEYLDDRKLDNFSKHRILSEFYLSVENCGRYPENIPLSDCRKCKHCGGISKNYVYCGYENSITDKVSLHLTPDRRKGYDLLVKQRKNKCWYCESEGTLVIEHGEAFCTRCGKKTWLETYDCDF